MTYLKILLLAILSCIFQSTLQAQPVHITGSIDSKDLSFITIVQLGIAGNGEPNKEYKTKVAENGSFFTAIENIEEGMYKIKDAYIGHKIYISPGDSVSIQLKKKAKPSFENFHKMNVETGYPMNYMFFDSCLSFFGHTKPEFSKTNFDDKIYKEECYERYKRATDLLAHFHRERQITDSFFHYAQIELKANYFEWLLFPFAKYRLNKNSVDPAYFHELETFHFDDPNAIAKTEQYLIVAERYNNFGLNTIDDMDPGPWLYSTFRTAADHFTGIPRDLLMARKIEEIIRFKPGDVLELKATLSAFLKICETPFLRDEVLAKIDAWASRIKNKPAAFRELMDQEIYTDLPGNNFSINSLPVKKRWILIDCWATWCTPCKEQDLFFGYFQEKYQDSIAFLKFSLDSDTSAWKRDMREHGKDSTINFLVKGGTENLFSSFFEIKTIPRFIFIDVKNKKIINDNMPFPKDKEQFEQVLVSVLNEKS